MGDDDLIARLRAEMDQAREGMKELAQNMWAFYGGLRDAGFSKAQAFTLTRDLMAVSLSQSYDDEGEGGDE